jgi:alpha-glucosidase
VALGASPAQAALQRTVFAGPLSVAVTSDPWQLTFSQSPGGEFLAERAGGGASPTGALGFADATGRWAHATRVVSEQLAGNVYTATLATSDPLDRQLSVRIANGGAGVLAVRARVTGPLTGDVASTGIAFDARASERFLGFGERSDAVDQRGAAIENYVSDGPYRASERPFVAAFVPLAGFRPRDDATYFPIPWLLSSAGYGVLLDNDETSMFRLGSEDAGAWSAEASARELRFRVFAGPTPARALARYTAAVGRQPAPAAPFYFGPWFQPPKGVSDAAAIDALRQADAPASVMQTYTHYLPCGDQRGKTAEQRARTAAGHAAGLAVTTYFNPMVCTGYETAYESGAAQGVFTKDQTGRPLQYRYTGSAQFLVSQVDFSAPRAGGYYGGLLQEAVDDGYDGWMEDFGEYTPADAKSANGHAGAEEHNPYVARYHGAARAFAARTARPLARFNRSGWTGSAKDSQIVWGGDPSTVWDFDGLRSAVRQALSIGLSGVSLWGSDIGGYFTVFDAPQLTPELLARWIELGAVSGVMRTQANGSTISADSSRRPQITDADVLPVWRRYAKLRTQLYPYLAGAELSYDRLGLPLMRALALIYAGDAAAAARDDEFMLGPDLLAAPVLGPAERTRAVQLPAGRWIDLWRSASVAADGSLRLGAARAARGGRSIDVPAPLDQLPLFARAGTVLPLLPADVDTLTGYGRAPGLVHLADRRSRLSLLAFPRGVSGARLGPEGALTSRERPAGWTLHVVSRTRRTYALQASLRTLAHPFRPCAVRLDGRALPRRAWSYARATGVLRARFALRSGTLAVARRC